MKKTHLVEDFNHRRLCYHTADSGIFFPSLRIKLWGKWKQTIRQWVAVSAPATNIPTGVHAPGTLACNDSTQWVLSPHLKEQGRAFRESGRKVAQGLTLTQILNCPTVTTEQLKIQEN